MPLQQAEDQGMELIDEKVKRSNKVLVESKFMIENILKITSRKKDPKKIKFYIGLPIYHTGMNENETTPFSSKPIRFFSFKNMVHDYIGTMQKRNIRIRVSIAARS